jgi:hypothetical protein
LVDEHNKNVKAFSIWENEEIRRIAMQTSLRTDWRSVDEFGNRLTRVNTGNTMSVPNLIAHLDTHPFLDRRRLDIFEDNGSSVWSVSIDPLIGAATPNLQLAWLNDQAPGIPSFKSHKVRAEELKEMIITFGGERASKVEPLKDDVRKARASYDLLRRNLKIVIVDIADSRLRGKCRTEDTL